MHIYNHSHTCTSSRSASKLIRKYTHAHTHTPTRTSTHKHAQVHTHTYTHVCVRRSCIRLRILRFGRTKFFRNNRSHALNSLACDMPLLVPYRIRYRLSVSAEKSKIKFCFLPLGGVKCKTQINFFRALIVVVSR